MFKKFDKNTFQLLNNQWNVLALVGNGFDISVLRKFKKGKMAGKTTSYTDFYDYITYFNLTNHNNILYQKMTESKEEGKENWSDFEDIIKNIYEDKNINHENLEKSIDEFQKYFTIFLNDLVDSDILLKLNEEVINNELSIQSLGEFLKDLDYSNLEDLKFKENLYHYNLFNFVFVNFNYTSLLDNYIYLDKLQFDPHIYKTRDTNFHFKFKLENSNTETDYSTYIISDIIHPHGLQDVPRSILFGIDLKEYNKGGTST
ncbi:AbiH family protein [Helcococcus bovis]